MDKAARLDLENLFHSRQGTRIFINKNIRPRKVKNKIYCIYSLYYTPIIRHVKIQSEANPYLKEYDKYFENRAKQRIAQRAKLQQLTQYFEQ